MHLQSMNYSDIFFHKLCSYSYWQKSWTHWHCCTDAALRCRGKLGMSGGKSAEICVTNSIQTQIQPEGEFLLICEFSYTNTLLQLFGQSLALHQTCLLLKTRQFSGLPATFILSLIFSHLTKIFFNHSYYTVCFTSPPIWFSLLFAAPLMGSFIFQGFVATCCWFNIFTYSNNEIFFFESKREFLFHSVWIKGKILDVESWTHVRASLKGRRDKVVMNMSIFCCLLTAFSPLKRPFSTVQENDFSVLYTKDKTAGGEKEAEDWESERHGVLL